MRILRKLVGIIMLLIPFGGAFYVTYYFGGLEISLLIWGAAILAFLYFIVALLLIQDNPFKEIGILEDRIDELKEYISALEDDMGEMDTDLTMLTEEVSKIRLPKREVVLEWQRSNPNGSQKLCAEETGVSLTTVRKYWT